MYRSWGWNNPRRWRKNCGRGARALAPFGEQALRLRELADLIVQRKA
jgi:hypothetical protein